MIRYHLIATVSLATLAAGLLAPTRADQPQPPLATKTSVYPPNATDAEKREVDLLRFRRTVDAETRKTLVAAFPFESLEARLKFDTPGRARVSKTFPTPEFDFDALRRQLHTKDAAKVSRQAVATMLLEDKFRRESQYDRMRALAKLHEVEVQQFVTNPGFGHMRLVWMPSRQPDVPPKDWSEADRGEAVSLPAEGGFFNGGADKTAPTLPSVLALSHFHASTAHEFVHSDSWGLVKDKTRVAGFKPHALAGLPDQNARARYDQTKPIKDGRVTAYTQVERWAVRKVELIGLLMHDAPVVYLNPDGKLPAMDAVKDGGTRELTEFESGGLKDLAAGKDVVALDATTNQVRMVGAIRMAGACMKCHDGKRGDLLGAFTYDLVRDPAFVPVQK